MKPSTAQARFCPEPINCGIEADDGTLY